MSVITVDSSKEQKDVSTENAVITTGTGGSESKAEIPPQLPTISLLKWPMTTLKVVLM